MAATKDYDPVFHGVQSLKPGLEVWRVENMKVVPYPKSEHGKFYTGDSYIVLKTTGLKTGGVAHSVHYWIGKETTADEAIFAAIKSVELDAALGGKTVQYRELQGHESDLFLSYFRPCVLPLPGGFRTGTDGVGKKEKRLFQVRGRRFVRVRQTPFIRSSLSHSDIFVVDSGAKLFQFNGANSSKQERLRAIEVTQCVRRVFHAGNCPVALIEDGKLDDADSNEFWDLFGGFAPIAKKSSSEDDVEVKHTPAVLYWASDDGLTEVSSGAGLKKVQLEGNKCYVVDTSSEIFVWFGRVSSVDDRKIASSIAEEMLRKEKRAPAVKVARVVERFESAGFKACFPDWPHAPVLVGGGEGGSKLKGMLKQAGVTDKAVGKVGADSGPSLPALTEIAGDFKVFRLDGAGKSQVPAEEVGRFSSGDCFLVNYTFTRDRKHEYVLFCWMGKNSTQEEKTSAMVAAAKMADALRGNVTLVRVVQGKEPEQFLSLFKTNLFFFKGGNSATYKKAASVGQYDPAGNALFLVKPSPSATKKDLFMATQVDLSSRSLNSSHCLVLQTNNAAFSWIGGKSGEPDKAAAHAAGDILKPGVQVKQMLEGKETSVFWSYLGGKGADYPAARESREAPRDGRMFQLITGGGGALKYLEIPNYSQDDLIAEDLIVLDVHTEVFVWVGSALSDAEKREAMDHGMKFLEFMVASEGRSKDTSVIRVSDGFEPPMFTALFEWDPTKSATIMDPYQRRLAELQNKALPELEAVKRKFGMLTVSTETPSAPTPPSPSAQPAVAPSPGSAETLSSPSFASTQRAAALAALSGAIAGVKKKPVEPAAAEKKPAVAVSVIAPPAPETEETTAEPSPSSSQRAAALAALQGTLNAEKKFSGGVYGKSHSFSKQQPHHLDEPSPPPPNTPAVHSDSATAHHSSFSPGADSPAGPAADAPAPIPEESAATSASEEGGFYSLERLTIKSTNPAPGIDTKKRESYLSDEAFEAVLGTSKVKFYQLPKWKQDQKKRSVDLF